MGVLGAAVLTGCTLQEWQRGAMPEPITDEGPITLQFWQATWIVALIIGALVWGLILFACVAYRRKKGDTTIPRQTRYHMPIETLWTIAPLILVIGIFYFAARDETELNTVSNQEELTVGVVGFRWSWTFNYKDQQVFDTGEPAYSPQENDAGFVPANPVGLPTLWLPVNKKVKFELTSPDVIHSFWAIPFLYKLDVVPGRTNVFEVTPTVTGLYAGKCAELCGVDHSRMLFNVNVVTQAEFDAHVAELRAKGQTGQLETGRTTNNAQDV
jgi:cytochrome c oxidase subunit 2